MVMDMFTVLMIVIVSQLYSFYQNHQNVNIKYIQLFISKSYHNKVLCVCACVCVWKRERWIPGKGFSYQKLILVYTCAFINLAAHSDRNIESAEFGSDTVSVKHLAILHRLSFTTAALCWKTSFSQKCSILQPRNLLQEKNIVSALKLGLKLLTLES